MKIDAIPMCPPQSGFASIYVTVADTFQGEWRTARMESDLSYTSVLRRGSDVERGAGTVDAQLGASLISAADAFLASSPPARQIEDRVQDAPIITIGIDVDGRLQKFMTDGVTVTPATQALLDALRAAGLS